MDEQLLKNVTDTLASGDVHTIRAALADAQTGPVIRGYLKDEAREIGKIVTDAMYPGMSPRAFFDAVPAELLARSLEYVVQTAVTVAHTETVWRTVFPLDTDMPAGAVTKVYTIYDGVAMAAWYVEGAKHPNVAVGSTRKTISFSPFSNAYTLNVLSLMKAQYAGFAEETQKAARAQEGHDEFFEQLFFVGDSTAGYSGLVDHPNITSGSLTAGDWNDSTTTAAEIIADVGGIIQTIVTANEGNPKFRGKKIDIVLKPSMGFILRTTIANTYTNESIEAILRKMYGEYLGRIIDAPILAATAAGAGDYVWFGVFSDMNAICAPVSMDTVSMPRDDRGMEIEQPYVSMAAPLHVKEPLWFYQAEGALYTA